MTSADGCISGRLGCSPFGAPRWCRAVIVEPEGHIAECGSNALQWTRSTWAAPPQQDRQCLLREPLVGSRDDRALLVEAGSTQGGLEPLRLVDQIAVVGLGHLPFLRVLETEQAMPPHMPVPGLFNHGRGGR